MLFLHFGISLCDMLTCLVSYMAAGWSGSEGHAPGFPDDGSWVVKHEGLVKSL